MIVGAGAGFDIQMPVGDRLAYLIAGHFNVGFKEGRKATGDDLTVDALTILAQQDDKRADAHPYYRTGQKISGGLLGWSASIDG